MEHADPDHDAIQNTAMARQLAALVLSAQLGAGTAPGQAARRLAMEVLGIDDDGRGLDKQFIVTEGTTRTAALDEPVFPILGRDVVSSDAVRAWIDLARKAGAADDILHSATLCAARMDAWKPKKVPNMRPTAPPIAAAKPATLAPEPPTEAATPQVLVSEPPTMPAERGCLRTVAPMIHHYILQPGVPIDDINRDGFFDPCADMLVPGDVIYITAALPDGSVLTEMRSVAHTLPCVRIRRMR